MTLILFIIGYLIMFIVAYFFARAWYEFPKLVEDTMKYRKQAGEDIIKIMELKKEIWKIKGETKND